MDVLTAYFTLLGIKEKFYTKTENFDGTAAAATTSAKPAATTTAATPAATSSSKSTGAAGAIIFVVFLIIIGVIGLICGIFAAKLSWSSNTVAEWGNGPKTFFAIVAFFYGISYLFSHLIHKVDLLAKIKKLTGGEVTGSVRNAMPMPNRMMAEQQRQPMQRPRMQDSDSY